MDTQLTKSLKTTLSKTVNSMRDLEWREVNKMWFEYATSSNSGDLTELQGPSWLD